MKTIGAYEKCRQYIESHSHLKDDSDRYIVNQQLPFITISRETGAGADVVSELLAELLQSFNKENTVHWTVFDKNLIEKVLEDHNLPKLVGRYMSEDKHSDLSAALNEMLGLQPSRWTLVHHTTKTIIQLARIGNVILVGRGANVITADFRNAVHVRLISPFENRINHVMEFYNLNRKDASEFIKREDVARRKYVLSNYFKDVEDPRQYHLVINTGLTGYEHASELIFEFVRKKFSEVFWENE